MKKRSSSFCSIAVALVALAIIVSPAVKAQTGSAGAAAQKPPATPASRGNAQKGQQLFTSDGWYECHGREGQGSTATGPRLAPRPIPFAALSKYVRQPTGQMPPFTSKVVSDAELADIYAFLQSRPQPPAVESLPLLNP